MVNSSNVELLETISKSGTPNCLRGLLLPRRESASAGGDAKNAKRLCHCICSLSE